MKQRLSLLLSATFASLVVVAADIQPPGDEWIDGGTLPKIFQSAVRQSNVLLHAEVLAGTLRVACPAGALPGGEPVLCSSADPDGHWPARDWRSQRMQRSGTNWHATVAVDSVEVPIVYFVATLNPSGTNVSRMRLCRPRVLGLEEPTRYFWPFLEGFEQGLESWTLFSEGIPLRAAAPGKHGKASLHATIPAGKSSVSIGTTRLRGWFVEEHGATGLALWARTRGGTGDAKITLVANAFSTNQVVAPAHRFPLQSNWTKLQVPFDLTGRFPLGAVDLVSIELVGRAGMEFMLDNLHLLGFWNIGE